MRGDDDSGATARFVPERLPNNVGRFGIQVAGWFVAENYARAVQQGAALIERMDNGTVTISDEELAALQDTCVASDGGGGLTDGAAAFVVLLVDLAPVCRAHHGDRQFSVKDVVDHPVTPDTHAPRMLLAHELARPWGPRICGQFLNRIEYALTCCSRHFLDLPSCRCG